MANFNGKRANQIAALKRKNITLVKEIKQYIKEQEKPTDQVEHLDRLVKDASRCSNYSLYGTSFTGDIKYFAGMMCGNKGCFVCNYARQKRTRRRYLNWFKQNKELLLIRRNGVNKYATNDRFKAYFKNRGWQIIKHIGYDVMHLTLTVPHYADTGFCGDQYYYAKIADMFHHLRNECPQWQTLVPGGEYGIETAKSNNGLHIHIHSLLFVRQLKRNRNRLHRLILKEWNKRTVNSYSSRTSFDESTIELIKKSNSMLTTEDVLEMNPQGTTMINLETIYSLQDGEKVRSKEFASDAMMRGVLEAIKYHFAPLAFDKENKTFDLGLMSEILPVIYRRQLYRKFGCLHGEKALNLKEDADSMAEDYQEVTELFDENTGEVLQEYNFFIVNPAYVYTNPEKDYQIILSGEAKRRMKKLNASSVRQAIDVMGQMVKSQYKR